MRLLQPHLEWLRGLHVDAQRGGAAVRILPGHAGGLPRGLRRAHVRHGQRGDQLLGHPIRILHIIRGAGVRQLCTGLEPGSRREHRWHHHNRFLSGLHRAPGTHVHQRRHGGGPHHSPGQVRVRLPEDRDHSSGGGHHHSGSGGVPLRLPADLLREDGHPDHSHHRAQLLLRTGVLHGGAVSDRAGGAAGRHQAHGNSCQTRNNGGTHPHSHRRHTHSH
mmetsp:Transcript_4547/g.10238  ORF Transcript_4547/g.10238 Transcript_4547/m.10238 type:complete len:219 (+) Transcript_4547:868-1524(+)